MTTSVHMYKGSLIGQGPISPRQGIYEESATAKALLGTRLKVGDRTFHYALDSGSGLAAGKLVTPYSVNQANITGDLPTAAVTEGSYTLTLISAAAQTDLAEGYMVVQDGTGYGEGGIYKIKKSSANASTATYTDLVLYDPILTPLSSTVSYCTCHTNPYYKLKLSATITDPIIGIPPIAVTADYYFWCQTWGPAMALTLTGATTAVGSILIPGADDGSVEIAVGFTSNLLGFQYLVGATTDYSTIWLQIEPQEGGVQCLMQLVQQNAS